jgi:hypothetical protein
MNHCNWSGQTHFLPPIDLQVVLRLVSLFIRKVRMESCGVVTMPEESLQQNSASSIRSINLVASFRKEGPSKPFLSASCAHVTPP